LKIRFAELVYQGFWTALDWIYPPVCAACGEPGYRLCINCHSKIKFYKNREHVFSSGELDGMTCHEPENERAVWVLAEYDGVVRECVHALKYGNNHGIGEMFAVWLAEMVKDEGPEADLVVPVPLSQQRQKERGYNQAARIAKPLALHLGMTYSPFAVARVRETRSQVGLSVTERQLNVAGAFRAQPAIVKDKRVLLVDDVITTGATMRACSMALVLAGALSVVCVSVAGLPRKKPVSVLIKHPV